MSFDFPVLGIDLVFYVLSGVSVKGTPPTNTALLMTDHLAQVGNGICVYYHAVKDLSLSPDTISRLRVTRGYITYSGSRYKDERCSWHQRSAVGRFSKSLKDHFCSYTDTRNRR